MKKRADAIIGALKLYELDYSNTHERVRVDQDCLEDCELKFKNEIALKYKDEKVIVSLTGGTRG